MYQTEFNALLQREQRMLAEISADTKAEMLRHQKTMQSIRLQLDELNEVLLMLVRESSHIGLVDTQRFHAMTKKELRIAAGVGHSKFAEWMRDPDTVASLSALGVSKMAKFLPTSAVAYLCGKYGIILEKSSDLP